MRSARSAAHTPSASSAAQLSAYKAGPTGENNTKIAPPRAEPKVPGAIGAKPVPAPVAMASTTPRARPEPLSWLLVMSAPQGPRRTSERGLGRGRPNGGFGPRSVSPRVAASQGPLYRVERLLDISRRGRGGGAMAAEAASRLRTAPELATLLLE